MDNVTESKEYGTLLREHKELVAEHIRLESTPFDQNAHNVHRKRLIDHNKRLHDFVAKHFATPAIAAQKQDDRKRGRSLSATKAK